MVIISIIEALLKIIVIVTTAIIITIETRLKLIINSIIINISVSIIISTSIIIIIIIVIPPASARSLELTRPGRGAYSGPPAHVCRCPVVGGAVVVVAGCGWLRSLRFASAVLSLSLGAAALGATGPLRGSGSVPPPLCGGAALPCVQLPSLQRGRQPSAEAGRVGMPRRGGVTLPCKLLAIIIIIIVVIIIIIIIEQQRTAIIIQHHGHHQHP